MLLQLLTSITESMWQYEDNNNSWEGDQSKRGHFCELTAASAVRYAINILIALACNSEERV